MFPPWMPTMQPYFCSMIIRAAAVPKRVARTRS